MFIVLQMTRFIPAGRSLNYGVCVVHCALPMLRNKINKDTFGFVVFFLLYKLGGILLRKQL